MTELNGTQPQRAGGCKCGRNLIDGGTCVFCGHGSATVRYTVLPTPPVAVITPRRDPRTWTPIMVLAAIRRWEHDTGRPPRITEWTSAGAWWPSKHTVTRMFGNWKTAIRAAGLEPPASGRPVDQPDQEAA